MYRKLKLMFLAASLMLAAGASAQTRVISHRGYWTPAGSAQNSITSLNGANRLGAYGSEFDVHITKDGVVMVNHDRVLPDGTNIELASYKKLRKETLSNGERLPTFRQYLQAGRKLNGTQLICEIKAHITNEAEDRCIDSCTQLGKTGRNGKTGRIHFFQQECLSIPCPPYFCRNKDLIPGW
jgi:glycerophosphoryl diester phosphodiesterase